MRHSENFNKFERDAKISWRVVKDIQRHLENCNTPKDPIKIWRNITFGKTPRDIAEDFKRHPKDTQGYRKDSQRCVEN